MNTVEQHCRDWAHYWFGYFLTEPHIVCPEIPLVADFVDPRWEHSKKAGIQNYLRECFYGGLPLAPSTEKCLLCDQMIPKASWHWDGEWHWPTRLVHYVEAHHVRLPDRMVKRIEAQNFRPPISIPDVLYEQLPCRLRYGRKGIFSVG
jgi:hypothetical protein